MDGAKNGYQATPNATLEQQVDTCPTCGSECNERDELTKAEREIERLRAEVEALKALVEELAMHDSHSTEYDGRMIVLCPDCGGQDGTNTTGCVFVRAKAHIDAARAAQGERG